MSQVSEVCSCCRRLSVGQLRWSDVTEQWPKFTQQETTKWTAESSCWWKIVAVTTERTTEISATKSLLCCLLFFRGLSLLFSVVYQHSYVLGYYDKYINQNSYVRHTSLVEVNCIRAFSWCIVEILKYIHCTTSLPSFFWCQEPVLGFCTLLCCLKEEFVATE